MTLRDDLAAAAALLTRLPVPDHRPSGAGAAWAWPLVGGAVAACAALAAALALALGLSPVLAAVIAIATEAVLTGALHEDGLADSADGLFGGRDKARRLEIMKDSRIGTFGALALVLVTLARWGALVTLLQAGDYGAVIAAAALSRAAMPALMAALPNARGDGLSSLTGRPTPAAAGLAAVAGLAVALVAAGLSAIAMALASAAAAVAVAAVARARIGGQTGDILGAAQQCALVAALAAA